MVCHTWWNTGLACSSPAIQQFSGGEKPWNLSSLFSHLWWVQMFTYRLCQLLWEVSLNISKASQSNWQIQAFDTGRDCYLPHRPLTFTVSKLTKLVDLSSAFYTGEISVCKERWEGGMWAEDHHLSPFLCWGAVAGVTSTQDFSVKCLYLFSPAPHKGECLWLPNFLGKGKRKEENSLMTFFF